MYIQDSTYETRLSCPIWLVSGCLQLSEPDDLPSIHISTNDSSPRLAALPILYEKLVAVLQMKASELTRLLIESAQTYAHGGCSQARPERTLDHMQKHFRIPRSPQL